MCRLLRCIEGAQSNVKEEGRMAYHDNNKLICQNAGVAERELLSALVSMHVHTSAP